MNRKSHILLLMVTLAAALSLTPSRIQAQPAAPGAEVRVTVNQPVTVEPSEVVIEALDGAPLPEKTSIRVASNTDDEFGPILFEKPGTYTYRVYQKPGSQRGVTYDQSVYTVWVSLESNGDGTTAYLVKARADGSSEKGDVVFNNSVESKTVTPSPGKTPETGDASNGLWVGLAVTALAFIGLSRRASQS